ncbi:MAG: hypothetical protein IT392_11670 [Nitrospirae bacterium]|nr:hypothetical protein [Nitrospirota bacterium]
MIQVILSKREMSCHAELISASHIDAETILKLIQLKVQGDNSPPFTGALHYLHISH